MYVPIDLVYQNMIKISRNYSEYLKVTCFATALVWKVLASRKNYLLKREKGNR